MKRALRLFGSLVLVCTFYSNVTGDYHSNDVANASMHGMSSTSTNGIGTYLAVEAGPGPMSSTVTVG